MQQVKCLRQIQNLLLFRKRLATHSDAIQQGTDFRESECIALQSSCIPHKVGQLPGKPKEYTLCT